MALVAGSVAGDSEAGPVIDLGCGPGLTTRMLARWFPGRDIVGLDASEAFVSRAGSGAGAVDYVSFVRHDVRTVPLPGAPASVIYVRFLLAHLPDPAELVEAWTGDLLPGGRLVLEEVEWIRTADAVFTEYLDLMASVLRARQTELYVGSVLGQLQPSECEVDHNKVARLDPTTADAAGLFSLNLTTVRLDPAVTGRRSEAELDSLAGALAGRLDDGRTGSISWGMRQVVLRRER